MGKKYSSDKELELDEIFMDSKNLPGFEQGQFEGRLERPLKKKTFWYLGLFISGIFIFMWYRSFDAQIVNGTIFRERAEMNRLKASPLWPERGLVLDRNGEVLAENEPAFRLVLETENLEPSKSEARLYELAAEKTLKIPEDENLFETAALAKSNRQNVILGIFYDWEETEKIKSQYRDLPLEVEQFSSRGYPEKDFMAHVLGYTGEPSPEDIPRETWRGWQNALGKTGIEERYDYELGGEVGIKLAEVEADGKILSENIQKPPKNGRTLTLTIDSGLQEKVYESIRDVIQARGFKGGAAVMLDVNTGEILSLVSYPSFDPNLLVKGGSENGISKILSGEGGSLFNRAVSGLYPAGSTIKPLLAIAALEEGIITPEKEILSTGSISIPNPYRPGEASVFYDWKPHGWVDMKQAIANSSNVYFYTIGGGFGDIAGLGVKKIQEYAAKFGFGEKTGVDLLEEKSGLVPGPEWKKENDKSEPDWRVGDTYNLSIGQGNLQVTPLQMATFTASLANGGKILKPYILKSLSENGETIMEKKPELAREIKIEESNLRVIREGMKLAVEIGTARSLSGLGLEIAGKTGTAEIGSGSKVNSWLIGFFPYENPRVAMAVVLEGGSASNLVGAPAASSQIIGWLIQNRPELIN